jgi:hypothetical protein
MRFARLRVDSSQADSAIRIGGARLVKVSKRVTRIPAENSLVTAFPAKRLNVGVGANFLAGSARWLLRIGFGATNSQAEKRRDYDSGSSNPRCLYGVRHMHRSPTKDRRIRGAAPILEVKRQLIRDDFRDHFSEMNRQVFGGTE